MQNHPEMEGTPFDQLVKEIAQHDTCDVWCKGCGDFRKMNAQFAKYIKTGEISFCGRCRGK